MMSPRFPFCFHDGVQKSLLRLAEDRYEDLELWYPKMRLEEAGFAVRVAAPEVKIHRGKHGYPATADALISEVRGEDFCGLLIPGEFIAG